MGAYKEDHLVVRAEEVLELLAEQGCPEHPVRVIIEQTAFTIALHYECCQYSGSKAAELKLAPEPQFTSVETLAQAQAVYQGWLSTLAERGFDVVGVPERVGLYNPERGGGVVMERSTDGKDSAEVVEFEVRGVLEMDVVYRILP